jgi:Glycosyl transferase family 2
VAYSDPSPDSADESCYQVMMPRTPLVSIVIACFNSERTLVHTLESVLRQSLQEFALNDGSTDGTGAL